MQTQSYKLTNDQGDTYTLHCVVWENTLVVATAHGWQTQNKSRLLDETKVAVDESSELANAIERSLDKISDTGTMPMRIVTNENMYQFVDKFMKEWGEDILCSDLVKIFNERVPKIEIPNEFVDPLVFFAGSKLLLCQLITFFRKGAFAVKPTSNGQLKRD